MPEEKQTKTCKYCKEEIDKKAKNCPHCGKDVRGWINRHPIISIVLIFIVFAYFVGFILEDDYGNYTPRSSNSSSNQTTSATTQNRSTTPKTTQQKELLELIDYNCYKQSDYFITEGQVKNISSLPIESVEAVVTAYTEDNKFVRSDSSFIEYNPIMPNQVSPFKVMMRDNPQIKRCKVEFKEFWGSEIPTKK